jgi:hypothetical protein
MEPKTESVPADQAPSLPAAEESPPATTPVPEPPTEIPADDDSPPDFGALNDLPPPTAVEPTEPSDFDDLFQETPDTTEPADETRDDSLNDLFDESPATETPPTETPATETPADALDDLFDETPDTPAEQPPVETPADALDDLFDDAPQPGEEQDPPPATDEPADTLDDLFSETPEPAQPADPSSDAPANDGAESLGDLFGDSTDTADDSPAMPEGDEGLDSLFDENPPTPADADGGESFDDSLDDLFGGEEAASPAESSPPSAEPSLDDDLDDLFGDSASTDVPARIEPAVAAADSAMELGSDDASPHLATSLIKPVRGRIVEASTPVASAKLDEGQLPVRQWTDNTGTFNTTARLAEVTDSCVRLLKDNGRFATVPLRRLSAADSEYVREHASHRDHGPVVELAGR